MEGPRRKGVVPTRASGVSAKLPSSRVSSNLLSRAASHARDSSIDDDVSLTSLRFSDRFDETTTIGCEIPLATTDPIQASPPVVCLFLLTTTHRIESPALVSPRIAPLLPATRKHIYTATPWSDFPQLLLVFLPPSSSKISLNSQCELTSLDSRLRLSTPRLDSTINTFITKQHFNFAPAASQILVVLSSQQPT